MTLKFVIILQNLMKAYHRKSSKSKYDRKLTELDVETTRIRSRVNGVDVLFTFTYLHVYSQISSHVYCSQISSYVYCLQISSYVHCSQISSCVYCSQISSYVSLLAARRLVLCLLFSNIVLFLVYWFL